MKKIVGLVIVVLMAFSFAACNSDLQKKIDDLEAQLQAQTDKITELVQDSIKSPTFKVEDGVLMVTYDNGLTWSELGDIAGSDGEEGVTPTFKVENGKLLVSYDNGLTWSELDGDATMNPIKSIAFNNDGNLVITFMDGSTQIVVNEEHCFGDWHLVAGYQPPYCEQFWYARICANCGKTELRQGTESDHDWTVVTTQPTCTEQGYDTKTCEICGKTQVENYIQAPGHDWSEEFNYDSTHHWRDCLNCDEITDKDEHAEDNGYCSECGQNYNYSEGLEYTLNSSGTAYAVSGIGECSDTDVIIRSSYKGLPVTSIAASAFAGNSKITSVTIPNNVTEIGNYAFQECSSLTRVYLPDNVENLGLMPFIVCENLVEITVAEDNDEYKSVDGNLYTKDGSELIQYALGKTQTSFTVPDGVTSIGMGAFAYSNLQTIVIPEGVTSLGVSAFAYSYSLDNVNIPSTVTSWGFSTFSYCINLTNIHIENGVTSIGEAAFEGCLRLESIQLPDSLTNINKYSFKLCISLTNIAVSSGNTTYQSIDGNVYSADGKTLVLYAPGKTATEFVVPSGVTSIHDYAFAYCDMLTDVSFGGATVIGDYAFYECKNLANLTLSGVTSIGRYAFFGCSGLTSLTISDSVKNIGSYAFENCSGIENLTIGNGLTVLERAVFGDCTSLVSITFGSNITSIGIYAFANCTSLVSIALPESVQKIEKSAFDGCTNLRYNEYDNGYYLGSQDNPYFAFVRAKTTDITSCQINSNTKLIYDWAFEACESLTSIEIPNSVEILGMGVFVNCTSLESVTLSQSLTSIGDFAFVNCVLLSSIEIPNSVEILGMGVFANCDALESITLPANLTTIKDYCFFDCDNLEEILFDGTIDEWNEISLGLIWNSGVPAIEVVCSDGSVEIK